MNVQEIRNAVRDQLDLEVADLKDGLIDLYMLEGFQQTTANENRWPWLEQDWTVNATWDGAPIPLPADVGVVASVIGADGVALEHVSHEDAEEYYSGEGVGTPSLYSMWGGSLYLWPGSDAVQAYTVRGWRMLREDWFEQPALEPDCDPRLHASLVHYAISRAYAQQEDDVLSGFYLDTWRRMVAVSMTSIMRSRYQGRTIMGRGIGRRRMGRRYGLGFL